MYWDQASNTWASLANTTALETVKTGLVGGTIYQFKVRAYNKYGEGLFTDAVSVNTSQAPDQPAAPTLEVVGATSRSAGFDHSATTEKSRATRFSWPPLLATSSKARPFAMERPKPQSCTASWECTT